MTPYAQKNNLTISLDLELIRSEQALIAAENFTPYDINIDIILYIKQMQKLDPLTRMFVATAIMSNLLICDELFVDYNPKDINDYLYEQLGFWTRKEEISAAAKIKEMLADSEVNNKVEQLKAKNNYDKFGMMDKLFVKIERLVRPYVQEYRKYQTEETFWISPDKKLTSPKIAANFDYYRKYAYLADLRNSLTEIDEGRRESPENNYYGVPTDPQNLRNSTALYNILLGKSSVNDIGKVMFGSRLQEKMRD